MADPTNQFPPRGKKKTKLFIAVFTSILLIALTAGIAVSLRTTPAAVHGSHAVIKSSCSSTLYPELCYSAAAQATAAEMETTKDVVHVLLNYTITTVQHNHIAIAKKIESSGLTARETTALRDCLAMVDQSLDELRLTLKDLGSTDKSISELAEDLKTLLSGAMTNQESCLDGFSHDTDDKKVRESLLAGQTHVLRLCSNALAMINNITDDFAKQTTLSRKLLGKDESGVEWPEWLSAGDRKLLQSTTVTPDVTVAADGSGNYRTVSAAVAAAPEGSSKRYVIRIKAGVYRENVEVPSRKTNLMFVGDGRITTIITASRNVVDGSTTFNSATVAIVGAHFLARGITFQNAAGPSKHQAVALRVNADYSAFYQCGFIAYQDTLYVHSLRQYFVNCYIAGTVDFIFGNSAAVLQDCDIHARRPNPSQKNMVTAQGRDDPNQNTGIVIQKCRIGATSDLKPVQSSFPTYLGRPWKTYSRTVVMQTSISDVIHPDGWFPWDGNFALDTLYYAEHANTGAGASTANRVTWKGFRVIGSAEAQAFTAGQFIAGGSWLGSTGFPFFLGL